MSAVAPFGSFDGVWRAADRLDLLPPPVAAAVAAFADDGHADSILVVDTDPDHADTEVFCDVYGTPLDASANCVVVSGKRGGEVKLAACVVLATTRVDVNRTVRTWLDVRKASFAKMDMVLEETAMEYGGVTPLGLPAEWPLLIDDAVAATPNVLVGSGQRRGKLILPGELLTGLPNATVVSGLGR